MEERHENELVEHRNGIDSDLFRYSIKDIDAFDLLDDVVRVPVDEDDQQLQNDSSNYLREEIFLLMSLHRFSSLSVDFQMEKHIR